MRNRILLSLGVAFVLGSVLLTGCGEDKKAGIAAEANAICQNEHTQIKTQGLEQGRNFINKWKAWHDTRDTKNINIPDLEQVILLERLVESSLPKLKALKASEENQLKYNEYITVRERSLIALQKAASFAKRSAAGYRFTQLARQFATLDTQADSIAREIGLKECGKDVNQLLFEKFGTTERAT